MSLPETIKEAFRKSGEVLAAHKAQAVKDQAAHQTRLAPIDKKIARAQARLETLRQEREALLKQTRIPCEFCRDERPVNELTFIQTMWYTPPYGCTGGDYWNYGEGQYRCPACKKINRLIDLFARDWIAKLKPFFRQVEEVDK